MPALILIKSPNGMHVPQSFALKVLPHSKSIIGRQKESCDIVIDDGKQSVSRQHAVVVTDGGKYYFEDTSRNGSLINNKPVTGKTALNHEDRLKICDFLFRFHDERNLGPVPLPAGFLGNLPEPEDNGDNSTVQHSLGRNAAQEFLEVQPKERLRILLEVSTTLSRTIELDALLNQIADTLFMVFRQADRCFVIQLDEAGRPYAKVFRSRRINTDDRFSRTIIRKCLDSMQAFLSEDASSDYSLGAAQSIAEFRIRSVMCVPLATANGQPIGALQLDTQDIAKRFLEDDLKLLMIVANLCSVSVEKVQMLAALLRREKLQRELELARSVQLGFLPQKPPVADGYEFFDYYSAAQTVGGDYYDYIRYADGRIAIVLGDVAGKGVAASLLMAKLSAETRFCVLTQPDLGLAVSLLNEQLTLGGIGDRFVTMTSAVLNPQTHQVTIVNAGHQSPLWYRVSAVTYNESTDSNSTGLPLGAVTPFDYETTTITLEPGDSLTLFTDGMTDAQNRKGEYFTLQGMQDSVMTDTSLATDPRPRAIGERLIVAVQAHMEGRDQTDDIALVCFGRLPPGASASTASGVRTIGPRKPMV